MSRREELEKDRDKKEVGEVNNTELCIKAMIFYD